MDKIAILKRGLELGLDYSQTWTCYNGRDKACGKCGSCVERLEAFAENSCKNLSLVRTYKKGLNKDRRGAANHRREMDHTKDYVPG